VIRGHQRGKARGLPLRSSVGYMWVQRIRRKLQYGTKFLQIWCETSSMVAWLEREGREIFYFILFYEPCVIILLYVVS